MLRASLAALCIALTCGAAGAEPLTLTMTNLFAGCADPQACPVGVYVNDSPESRHELRGSDDPQSLLAGRRGRHLRPGLTAARWLAARGQLTVGLPIVPPNRAPRMHAAFSGLVPHAEYSLFTFRYGPVPGREAGRVGTGVSPSDDGGLGRTNIFRADANGDGEIDVTYADESPVFASAWVELIYSFTGSAGGPSPGSVGTTMAPQLICEIPPLSGAQ